MRLFGAINKIERDDDVLVVSGIASSEAVDSDGETVTAGAMREALPAYMAGGSGALREMHQPIAAGAVVYADVQDDGSTFVRARVIDRQAVAKVDEGVLRGFSIGGKALARDPGNRKRITKLRLTEISLVDRPANAECVFKVWSGADRAEDPLAAIKAALAAPYCGAQGVVDLLTEQPAYVGPKLDAVERAFRKALDNPCRGDREFLKMRGL
jgi:hypothetical protein